MSNGSPLADLARRVAAQAQAGEDVEAFVSRSRNTQVRAYQGDVESVNSASSAGIAVRVVVDGRQGFAYGGSLDDDVVENTLAEARDNARFAGVDEFNTIGAPDGVEPAGLTVDVGKLAGTPLDRKIDLALQLERASREGHPSVRGVETAMYVDDVSETAVATSTGIAAESESAHCYLVVSVLAGTPEETQTAYRYTVGDTVDELDVEGLAQETVDRAVRKLGAQQPQSRRLTVVLDPMVTSSFLSVIGGTLSGDAALKGYSPFASRMGESIGSALVTLVEDPTDPESYGASRYDAEGIATRRIPLIDAGVLRGFVHNSYTGKRSGAGSTGSAQRMAVNATVGVGCGALALAPGTKSPQELIASVDEGFLVEEVKGLHSGVNPVSGDFSVGAEGMLIRNGELAEPVREATIASTLQRMLQDVVAVANDEQRLPMAARGVTVAVRDVTMSGR